MLALKKIFGTRNQRLLRGYEKTVNKINKLEESFALLTQEELSGITQALKDRLAGGEVIADLLPEAFAAVREASKRTLGLRHFDVQLIGGMVLNDGKVAEMRTGEGKTLVATLPAYLNALTDKGVHIVTVNDYLAERDANWMRPVYETLGLTVGINLTHMSPEQKHAAYAADVTYGTNNEFGFDYMRDNMVFEPEQCVQRPLHFCVIDEVDSILIDEARTPLIISGAAEESSQLYRKINDLIPKLKLQTVVEEFNPLEGAKEIPEDQRGDFTLDEKNRQASLTEQGHQCIEEMLVKIGAIQAGESLYDFKNISIMHYVNAALRAHGLYKKDVDYVVKDGQVIIVDEHTGRLMDGRRWSEGLHQAVEAKEGVEIQLENQTLATITFQNFFRLYQKLSGMTGTADTEAFELQKIYGLEVVVIPTNKPMIRDDRADMLFLDHKSKYDAVIKEITECHNKGQPVLVGTASVEGSEYLSSLLKNKGIPHEVLNAKQHEREAKIIAQAGRSGAVTISTSMAGRGTDIVLGGNLEVELQEQAELTSSQEAAIKADWETRHQQVLAAGGLHVLCTERQESRRIDNQLRGRSGRQGDPGSSQFYLCMDDDLLRIFGGERMSAMMRKMGVKEGDVIQAGMMTRSIETAQRRVEGYNYDIRKQLLEFDDVANDQRKVVYQQRRLLLESQDISKTLTELREEAIAGMVERFMPPESLEEQWDVPGLEAQIKQDFTLSLPVQSWLDADGDLHAEQVTERVVDAVKRAYLDKIALLDEQSMRGIERAMMLQIMDTQWKDHLAAMEHLRQGIHLRGYAQKNPAQEFKRESFDMFQELMENIKFDFISTLSKVEFTSEPDISMQPAAPMNLNYQHSELDGLGREEQPVAMPQDDQAPFRRTQAKVGRNEPCPCGSGKKYKQCHGKLG